MKKLRLTDDAVKHYEELFPNHESKLQKTDPEFIELFDNWAFDEVIGQSKLDTKTRVMMILASTIASEALGEYKVMVGAASPNANVTPGSSPNAVTAGKKPIPPKSTPHREPVVTPKPTPEVKATAPPKQEITPPPQVQHTPAPQPQVLHTPPAQPQAQKTPTPQQPQRPQGGQKHEHGKGTPAPTP